jgi:hypothetical protein
MQIPTLWPSWPLTHAQALLAAVATASAAAAIAISGAGREVPSHRQPAT